MSKTNLPPSNGSQQDRRAITFTESLIIIVTIGVFFIVVLFRIPQNSFSLNKRSSTTAHISTSDTCKTPVDIATFIIACGKGDEDAVTEMRPLLTSVILLTSVPLRLIFITDNDGANRIRNMFTSLGRTRRKVIVQIITLSEDWMNNWANQTKINLYAHHSGLFGMSKLAAPWLLPSNISLGVVLDTDMVMLKDPAMLWAEAFQEEGGGFEKGWVYRMMLSKYMRRSGEICSCVVIIRLQKAREERIYPDKVRRIFERNASWKRRGLYSAPHGDQGVYYELWKLDKRLVGHLDGLWNRDHCHRYYGIFDIKDKSNAGILHRNCYKLRSEVNDSSIPFFDFFSAYRWHWLQPPKGDGCDVEI